MQGRCVFISGGVRSGKSAFAEHYIMQHKKQRQPVYIASGVAFDEEMANEMVNASQMGVDEANKIMDQKTGSQVKSNKGKRRTRSRRRLFKFSK